MMPIYLLYTTIYYVFFLFFKIYIFFMPIGNRIPKFVNISTHIIIAHRQLYIAKVLLNHHLRCYNFNDILEVDFPSEMSL